MAENTKYNGWSNDKCHEQTATTERGNAEDAISGNRSLNTQNAEVEDGTNGSQSVSHATPCAQKNCETRSGSESSTSTQTAHAHVANAESRDTESSISTTPTETESSIEQARDAEAIVPTSQQTKSETERDTESCAVTATGSHDSQTTYNGWSSYATWRVNLEILDDYVSSLVGDGPQWSSVEECAGVLEETVDEILTNYGQNEEGLALDYARAFVSDVDYREIAETILTDNPELFTDAHHFGQYCECPECQGE